MVSEEYLPPCQLPLGAGTLNQIDEADYRGQGEGAGWASHLRGVCLYNLSLALERQHQGSPCPTDVKGLVILVED
jgi:hypothetical protein